MSEYVIPNEWFSMDVNAENIRCRNYMYPDGKIIWIEKTPHEFMSENVVAWRYAIPLQKTHNDTQEEMP